MIAGRKKLTHLLEADGNQEVFDFTPSLFSIKVIKVAVSNDSDGARVHILQISMSMHSRNLEGDRRGGNDQNQSGH